MARPAPAEREPAAAGASDDGYRVGVGDLLAIAVFGHEDLSKSVRVSASGTINFPLLGDVLVSGMTPAEIVRRLTDMLGKDYVVNPQLLVGVSEYQSQPVNVIGEVHKPGKYFLRGPTRIIDILSEAEGLSENAGSEIIVTRYERGAVGGGASRQIRISTDALFAANNEAVNIPLAAGDMVRVQAAPFFYIRGEVGRPGQYPVRTETTIQKAISLAGGFTLWADQKGVQVIRQEGGQSKKVVLNMRKIAKGEAPDLKIEPEDVIVVARRIL
jgi:polysaccharide export outer membrane protein